MEACLKFSKDLVTASYNSEDMKKRDAEVREKNLIFLNEIGVDPGIDHLATMKVVDECREKGERYLIRLHY